MLGYVDDVLFVWYFVCFVYWFVVDLFVAGDYVDVYSCDVFGEVGWWHDVGFERGRCQIDRVDVGFLVVWGVRVVHVC